MPIKRCNIPQFLESFKTFLAHSQVHGRPKCDTHGYFCLIFGDIAIFTNSSTLISKTIVARGVLVRLIMTSLSK